MFDPLLRLWGIMGKGKEAVFKELSENNRNFSSVSSLFSFAESVLLLDYVFNTVSNFSRKNAENSLVFTQPEILRVQGFPNVHPLIKKNVSEERDF